MASQNFCFLFVTTILMVQLLVLGVNSVNSLEEGKSGDSCSEAQPCRIDFDCISGRCQCRFSGHQNYDRQSGLCLSLVGAPCAHLLDNGTMLEYNCSKNAVCKEVLGFPECVCEEGLVQSGRSCRVPLGHASKATAECSNPTSDTGIISINGRCDCPRLKVFDEKKKKCVGLVGAKCGTFNPCVEGVTCDKYESFEGICRCPGGATPTANRRCISQQCA